MTHMTIIRLRQLSRQFGISCRLVSGSCLRVGKYGGSVLCKGGTSWPPLVGVIQFFETCRQRGCSPAVKEGSGVNRSEPSLTAGLLPRQPSGVATECHPYKYISVLLFWEVVLYMQSSIKRFRVGSLAALAFLVLGLLFSTSAFHEGHHGGGPN